MIATHITYPVENIIDDLNRFDNTFHDTITAIKERPLENLGSLNAEVMKAFNNAIAAKVEQYRTLKYLYALNELEVGNFVYGSVLTPKRTLTLDTENFELECKEKTDYMDVRMWINAFFTTLIVRDDEGRTLLMQIPEEVFLSANLKPTEFELAFIRVLKGVFNPEANMGGLLTKSMEAFFDESVSPSEHKYYDALLFPILSLIRCILTNNEDEFNQHLEEAIINHKEYWGTTEDATNFDATGFASIPLLGICSLAYDNNEFSFNIVSDYIPEWLIKLPEQAA